MSDLSFKHLRTLPDHLSRLEEESLSQNFTMIARLRKDWDAGPNRFDADGEILVGAFRNAQLIGIGGLNRDPYAGDPSIGRLRHVYVLNQERRRAVGRGLIDRILEGAVDHFCLIRLWTAKASAFYESIGFEAINEPKATHRLIFDAVRANER